MKNHETTLKNHGNQQVLIFRYTQTELHQNIYIATKLLTHHHHLCQGCLVSKLAANLSNLMPDMEIWSKLLANTENSCNLKIEKLKIGNLVKIALKH